MTYRREIKAVADILTDPENESRSAEEVAEAAISRLDEVRSTTHNLVVVGRFSFDLEKQYMAALGPLSSRAPKAAREVGSRFAWDYKTRRGEGSFTVLPLLRNPQAAWDFLREREVPEESARKALGSITPSTVGEPGYEPMRFNLPDEVLDRITADWEPTKEYGPTCTCGLTKEYTLANRGYAKHGIAGAACAYHGEEESGV